MPPSSRPSPGVRKTPRVSARSQDTTEPGQIPSDIDHIDSLFEMAGLHRSRREKPAGVARRAAFQDKTPEELRPAPPLTSAARNRAEWIPVPAWQELPWIWHGFSTRRGGLSGCYAPKGALGELNLGFT